MRPLQQWIKCMQLIMHKRLYSKQELVFLSKSESNFVQEKHIILQCINMYYSVMTQAKNWWGSLLDSSVYKLYNISVQSQSTLWKMKMYIYNCAVYYIHVHKLKDITIGGKHCTLYTFMWYTVYKIEIKFFKA